MAKWSGIDKRNSVIIKKYLLVTILAALIFGAFAGCGGLGTYNKISSLGLLSGNEFELEIKNQQYYAGSRVLGLEFKTKSLTEEMIQKQIGDNLLYYALNGWYIEIDNGNGTKDSYYIISRGNNSYILTDMAVNVIHGGTRDESLFLIPKQLVRDERLLSYHTPYLYTDIPYESQLGITEFYNYYQAIGWYNVEISDNKLMLSSFKTEPSDKAYFKDQLLSRFPIEIEFFEKHGVNFFEITIGG